MMVNSNPYPLASIMGSPEEDKEALIKVDLVLNRA